MTHETTNIISLCAYREAASMQDMLAILERHNALASRSNETAPVSLGAGTKKKNTLKTVPASTMRPAR